MKTQGLLLLLVALFEVGDGRLQFLAIGDWGDTSLTRQERVAEAMDQFCATEQCDFIVTTGDNFYDDGVESLDDPKWDTVWRDVYDGENIKDLVWYISVGNHDHTFPGNFELYQVEYTDIEPRWQLPWLWHDKVFEVEDGVSLHIVLADSEAMWTRKHNVTAQEIYLEETLQNSDAEYVILVAHHPSYSTGRYFGNVATREYFDELSEEYDVDVFLTGHDHNIQHIVPIEPTVPYPTEHIISGAGGRRPYEFTPLNDNLINNAGYQSIYFGELNGFTVFDIDASEMKIKHYTYEDDEFGIAVPVLVHEYVRPQVR